MRPYRLVSILAGVLYPDVCRSCGTGLGGRSGLGDGGDGEKRGGPGGFFCEGCLASARELGNAYCGTCSKPFPSGSGGVRSCGECAAKPPPFEYARAPYLYAGAVKDAIQLFKYRGIRAMEGFLSSTFEGRITGWFPGAQVVAAVPLHPRRLAGRGFNQSLLLARTASRMLGAVLSVDGLVRTRNTRPQIDLSPEERERNVKGAFSAARPGEFAGMDVLLVDDVYTTGATVKECAKVLKKAGAFRVRVLTVARAD